MRFLLCHKNYLRRSGTNSNLKNKHILEIFSLSPFMCLSSLFLVLMIVAGSAHGTACALTAAAGSSLSFISYDSPDSKKDSCCQNQDHDDIAGIHTKPCQHSIFHLVFDSSRPHERSCGHDTHEAFLPFFIS